MQLEITETNSALTPRSAFLNIRWGSIFAGLAVGIASNILLMIIGAATGLSVLNVANVGSGEALPLAASLWNTVSMIVSAFIGGYIAARGSGLKRTSDGVLHAVVAWGMTLLLSVLLASTVTAATFGAMFPAAQGRTLQNTATVISTLDRGDRQSAIETVQRQFNLSASQASQLIDQALVLSGRQEEADSTGRVAAQNTVRTAATISVWLAVSIVLSLLTAIGGGLTGARGSRRILHRRVTHIS